MEKVLPAGNLFGLDIVLRAIVDSASDCSRLREEIKPGRHNGHFIKIKNDENSSLVRVLYTCIERSIVTSLRLHLHFLLQTAKMGIR